VQSVRQWADQSSAARLMTRPRALAFAGTEKRARAIADALNAQGAPCMGLCDEAPALQIVRDGGVDVVVLDLCSLRGTWAVTFAAGLRAAARCSRLAVVGLGAPGAASPGLPALSALDGFGLESGGWGLVVDMLKRSARLALMEEAAGWRGHVCENASARAVPDDRAGALVVGRPSRFYPMLESGLRARGVTVMAALTPISAMDWFQDAPPDGVIIDLAEQPERGLTLAKALRRNARWRTTPVALLAGPGFRTVQPANTCQIMDLVIGTTQDEAVLDRFTAAMRVKRREDALRRRLQGPIDAGQADPASRVFNREGFANAFVRTARQARLARRPLALTLARLRCADRPASAGSTGDKAIGFLRGLVRGHDIVGRLSRDVIAVAWVGVDGVSARQAVVRLSKAIDVTAFGAGGAGRLRLETTTAGLAPGETARHLLERAAGGLAGLEAG
jgi:PleD family two-component response regulator